MATSRVHLIVSGHVQGVFFRASTRERATDLGLTGWVKNRVDGTVEIVAEGPRDALGDLLAWCEDGGPELAEVSSVVPQWSEATDEFVDFTIVR